MKDTSLQHHKSAGFTLVEVLIALAVSGILLGSVFTAFQSQQKSYLAQDQVVEMQENIRVGLGIMVQDLRMAGYDPYSSGTTGIVTATASSVSFTLVADEDGVDNNSDGTTDEQGEIETVTYDVYDADGDGDQEIGRQTGANAKAVLAENFQALEFNSLDADNNQTADPAKIKSIQISGLARSGQPDSRFFNNSTYTSASGVDWGPYNDNIRRRFQVITVHLRNLDI